MSNIVEAVARAIEDSTDEFCSPVRLCISGEARIRWELENPGEDWYDTSESRAKLANYKFIARAAIDAHKAALAEAGFVIVLRGNLTVTNEGRSLPSEGHVIRIKPTRKSGAAAPD